MTAIATGPGCRSFISIPPDHGVGPEGRELRQRVVEAGDEVLRSETHGDSLRRSLSAIDGVCAECSVENWDGYGAGPVSEATRYYARQFVRMLPTSMPIPEISAEPDGEIAFEWHRGRSGVFSISVGGSDELTYAGLFGRSKAYGTEFFDDELPETIATHLRRLFSQ